jgi:hypothetical protein
MNFKNKVLWGIIGMMVFWFVYFYPVIVPYMIATNMYPLLAVLIYESLFFLTMHLATLFILGESNQHSLKITLVLFLLYHVWDAVEPPFVLGPTGTWAISGSSSYIVSWDYGVSYFLTNTFGITGPNLYYITNIGTVLAMALIAFALLKREQMIGKIMREVLG